MKDDKTNLIVQLTFNFALKVIDFSEEIRKLNRYEMASQVFKCGTSIGANGKEVQNAESKLDFIHKSKIAAKEADEMEYWLDLCKNSPHYPTPNNELFNELKSIVLIISKIISSSKKNKSSN